MKYCILLFAAAMLFSSCATLFTGTKDRIYFATEPKGAKVSINGLDQCRTPCDIDVKRKMEGQRVVLKHDGYQHKSIELSQEFNFVSAFNLLNIFFWGVDMITGSIMVYDQKVYDVKLEPGN